MSIDYAAEIRSRAKKAAESVRQMDLDHHLSRLDHAVSMWLGSEDAKLTAAYASGRKDEREEWLPVLEALKEFVDPFDGDLIETIEAECGYATAERVDRARAAIASVEGKS